jgi:16S rRNA (adenine1518-N6/adenine1519-N6)-dimethyltransferase
MVQQEVAMRMTATSGSSDYSSFSIFIRAYSTPSYAFTVSRNCFYPVPNVDSAIVTLTLRKPPLASHEVDTFFKIVRSGFQQRRKMLRSSLKNMFPPNLIEEALTAIGESPLARPEELSLEKFLELHKILSPKLPNQE